MGLISQDVTEAEGESPPNIHPNNGNAVDQEAGIGTVCVCVSLFRKVNKFD